MPTKACHYPDRCRKRAVQFSACEGGLNSCKSNSVELKGCVTMFSQPEIDYIRSQRLARIATVSSQQQPDVAPVVFEFDGERFYIGGRQQTTTLKYKNVLNGNRKVALVIDDVASTSPWQPRGLKIHGIAEIVERPGMVGFGFYLKITPEKRWSWGIERPVFENGEIVMKMPDQNTG
jgi:pyridoxamine 5'-phosphate oxidase family protein